MQRLIHIDPTRDESLQSQIRNKLVEGILVGSFALGSRLPSSRKLAQQIGVARNTVVLVYQTLLDEGYIVSRERSGIYVNEKIHQGWVNTSPLSTSYPAALSNHTHRFKGVCLALHATLCFRPIGKNTLILLSTASLMRPYIQLKNGVMPTNKPIALVKLTNGLNYRVWVMIRCCLSKYAPRSFLGVVFKPAVT